ncbi:hypothetical protein Scep_010864 [Stephania cephalantha]|uniref:Uncharacterized protein n=1 Tax=Stephania cephalantha TaxID=152367 RepID=A0AAP0JX76_9MAGN
MQWYFVAALLTILTSSQGILTTLSQSNGRYKYDYATVPFLAEVFKFSSLERVTCTESSKDDHGVEMRALVPYSFHHLFDPQQCSVCYSNLCGYLDVSDNGKFEDRHYGNIVQVKGCGEASCDSLFSAPLQGYMLGILSACLSALAGVYTEYLMKKNNDSLYWQNVQLYTFGAIFNMARLLLDDFRGGFENGPWWQRLLNGYGLTTWMVVLNLGSTGLLVSWLMKYADNIVKRRREIARDDDGWDYAEAKRDRERDLLRLREGEGGE